MRYGLARYASKKTGKEKKKMTNSVEKALLLTANYLKSVFDYGEEEIFTFCMEHNFTIEQTEKLQELMKK